MTGESTEVIVNRQQRTFHQMWGSASRHHLFLFKSYFYFRFGGRHFEFWMCVSAHVDSAISELGVIETVGVAGENAFVVVIKPEIYCI